MGIEQAACEQEQEETWKIHAETFEDGEKRVKQRSLQKDMKIIGIWSEP